MGDAVGYTVSPTSVGCLVGDGLGAGVGAADGAGVGEAEGAAVGGVG